MSEGPSLPTGATPESPGPIREAISSLLGVGELAFDRAGAFQRFTLTPGAFWRIFLLSRLVIPGSLSIHLARQLEQPALPAILTTILPTMAATAAGSLVAVRMAAFFQAQRTKQPVSMETIGPQALNFLIPTLWGDLFNVVLLLLLFSIGGNAANLLILAVVITVLLAQWRSARIGLRLTGWQSAGMVAAFSAVQFGVIIALGMIRTAFHGG